MPTTEFAEILAQAGLLTPADQALMGLAFIAVSFAVVGVVLIGGGWAIYAWVDRRRSRYMASE